MNTKQIDMKNHFQYEILRPSFRHSGCGKREHGNICAAIYFVSKMAAQYSVLDRDASVM